MGVEVDLVGEDADVQGGAVVGEAGLDPHRQQRHRHLAVERFDGGLGLDRRPAARSAAAPTSPVSSAAALVEVGSPALQVGHAPLGRSSAAPRLAGHAEVGELGLAGGELGARPPSSSVPTAPSSRAVLGDPVEVEVGHQASSVKARWRACTSTWTGFWNSASATVAPSAGTGCSPLGGGEPPQVLDGERRRGRDPGVGPRRLAPRR